LVRVGRLEGSGAPVAGCGADLDSLMMALAPMTVYIIVII
jgi:hypothetical protein